MKLSTKILTATLLVVGSSGAVYAFSKHGDRSMTPDEKVEFVTDRVVKELELDAMQRQNFSELAGLVADIVVAARADRQAQFSELSAMIEQPSFDQARAIELVQQKTRMIDDKVPQVIASLAIFLDSLNAEQKRSRSRFATRVSALPPMNCRG